jgi:methyl-galactoside transport system substrate-binding protein
VDATEAAKSLIKDKKMTGTVMQDADGMAEALVKLTQNALAENGGPMDHTEGLTVDEGVSKVRIAYAKYLG